MLNRRELVRLGLAGSAWPWLSRKGRRALIPPSFWDDPQSPPTTPFVTPLPLPPPPDPAPPFAPECDAPFPPVGFGSGPPSSRPGFTASSAGRARPLAARTRSLARGPVPTGGTTSTPSGGVRFYELVEEEVYVSLHPELPPTKVWRYRDKLAPASHPLMAGPTFHAYMNEPVVVRVHNGLPEVADHYGCGVPITTTHLHGGHMEARSDGFPGNTADGFTPEVEPGHFFDYCYAMRDTGFTTGEEDPEERPSTLWYHDHLLDFTGPNVYRGLSGFYIVYDELDAGDETLGGTLRLPSGANDIPLVLQDRLFAPDGSLVYLPGSFDGVLGDKYLVNGVVQPYHIVQRRKVRLRILNGANARFFQVALTDDHGTKYPFDLIATEGGLMSAPIRGTEDFTLVCAQRREIVVDFSQFPEGTVLYLEDLMDQDDGRGPGGDFEEPDLVDPGEGVRMLKLIVGGDAPDPSEVPDELRHTTPIPEEEIAAAERHHFEFERRNGAWAINDEFIDIDAPCVTVEKNTPQVWTFENGGGGWWHPIHVHLEYCRVLSRNGKTPPLYERDGMAKTDTVSLAGGDEVEVFFKFRDFPGRWVFHCHNIEHEDHFMMCRFDIV